MIGTLIRFKVYIPSLRDRRISCNTASGSAPDVGSADHFFGFLLLVAVGFRGLGVFRVFGVFGGLGFL